MVYTIHVEEVKSECVSPDKQKDRNTVASENTKGAKKS